MDKAKSKYKPKINFYFRKDKYDIFRRGVYRIMYRKSVVGYIKPKEDGFFISFIGNASEKQLAENPNCKWRWKIYNKSFDTLEDAQKVIKADQKAFFDMLYDGIKDGTDLF